MDSIYKSKIIFLAHLCLPAIISVKLNAQAGLSYQVRIKDTVAVEKYELQNNGFSNCSLAVKPGDYRIEAETVTKILGTETITAVDLVYSDYPKGENFAELNRKRIIELFMHLPQAFNRPVIQWRIVKQTGIKRQSDLSKYFHGFVVYYRPLPTFRDESGRIRDIVEGKVKPEDSVILKVMSRNKSWRDMLVVCDVTGSMAPYTAQLALWFKLNSELKTAKQIVFFNDDEEQSNTQDKAYDPKGIWDITSYDFKKILEVAETAMENGEHYENNLEAVFYAMKKFPDNKKNLLMIADNWEDPCDMQLLEKLKAMKVPVRIIVCGVQKTFNTKYLEIAYATGGSVHTMEDDLTGLSKLAEGKTFKLGGMEFRMSGGRFTQVH